MDKKELIGKEVIIITRYFLPNLNVDSDSVYQMIKSLKALDNDLKIHVVTTETKYKGDFIDNRRYSSELLKDIDVSRIKNYFGESKLPILKILSDLIDGYRLVARAKKKCINNIISLSNPPLISLWHSLLLKNRNFFYWTFDIFPQALAANNILNEFGVIYKILKKITYSSAPKSLISLGEHQYVYMLEQYKKEINRIILPCGVHNEKLNANTLPFWKDPNVITIGYLGNLGRAHSLEFLKNVITAVAEKPGLKLIISVYGYHKEKLLDHLKQFKSGNIQLIDFVDKTQLGLIDIHLVSLMKSWNNVSVPSKAVSAVCSGSSLWYCGEENVDTWDMFHDCSFKTSDQLNAISTFLDGLDNNVVTRKKNEAILIKEKLLSMEADAYKTILALLN